MSKRDQLLDAYGIIAARPTILFISHEASLTGAPGVLLTLMRYIKSHFRINLLCLVGGDLGTYDKNRIDEFHRICPVFGQHGIGRLQTLLKLLDRPIDIFCNSIASAALLEELFAAPSKLCARITSYIHELEKVQLSFDSETRYLLSRSARVLCVSHAVKDALKARSDAPRPEFHVIPPFIEIDNKVSNAPDGLDDDAHIPTVYGCGTLEERKGFDLFCETIEILLRDSGIDFSVCWLGPPAKNYDYHMYLQKYNLAKFLQMPGKVEKPTSFYRRGDIFFMSSREDPFPLVCLEAAYAGLPIVCFDERAGNTATYVRSAGCGLVADYCNPKDAATAIKLLLQNPNLREVQASKGIEYVKKHHDKDKLCASIADIIKSNDEPSFSLCSRNQKVVVVSFGPPPIFQDRVVEGGGLRCWGLAKGLKQSNPSWEVSLVFRDQEPSATSAFLGDSGLFVNVATWLSEESLIKHLELADIIVVSYCYGHFSELIASSVSANQTLILDCYVPIQIEVSARATLTPIQEHKSYMNDIMSWNRVLSQGDFLLCANEPQRHYYTGIIASMAKINPINYRHALSKVVIAPFGLDSASAKIKIDQMFTTITPPSRPQNKKFQLLWFGGVYPWFNLEHLFESVYSLNCTYNIPCQLTLVGVKNPFNTHAYFVNNADRVIEKASNSRYNGIVGLGEWVPYDRRHFYYENADLAICLNSEGIENQYSWRTRCVDYLENGMQYASNGGDPLTERLISIGFAYRINVSSEAGLAESLASVINRFKSECRPKDSVTKSSLEELVSELSWKNVGQSISNAIHRALLSRGLDHK